MIVVSINQEKKIELEQTREGILLNGKPGSYQIEKLSESAFKVFTDTKIYNVNVISRDGKKVTLNINNQEVETKIADHIDQILEKLGMDVAQPNLVKEVKAPMPGSILNILVDEGQEVKEGDPLLVLEAMKMENVIKSPGDGIVEKVNVSEKENVEKNHILISFK